MRLGRQTPTNTVVLPYSESTGKEAIDFYNSTGRKAMEWQEIQIESILAVNDDGLWTHTKYGLAVPRRNGKNEVVVMREMYGLIHGEKMCHTAHRTTTSHSAFLRIYDLIKKAGYKEHSRKKKEMPEKSFFASKQYGLEHIELTDGGMIDFRTRTNNGGLGEGFDLLVIDEAQEYTEKQEYSLLYTVSDSPNPQTIFCGTPPTAISGGNVFPKLRDQILSGNGVDSGWAEWSVEEQTDDIHDVDLWYETNPSMGIILTERNVRAEIRDDVIDFNIQRLGLWLRYSQKSEISEAEWMELKTTMPDLEKERYIGIKYGKDGLNVSMAIASRTTDERIFVEVIDCVPVRNGNGWMMDYFHNPNLKKVAIDGASGQQLLYKQMTDSGFKKPILPTVKEIITANATFEQGLFAKAICHSGQESLKQAVSNCEKRNIGPNGGFGYKSIIDTVDISIMDSMILAYWLCATSKTKGKQKISY